MHYTTHQGNFQLMSYQTLLLIRPQVALHLIDINDHYQNLDLMYFCRASTVSCQQNCHV